MSSRKFAVIFCPLYVPTYYLPAILSKKLTGSTMNLANLTQEEKDKINVDLAASGVAYMLKGTDSFDKKNTLESTRRTLDSMVKNGLLEKVSSYERRQNRHQGSSSSPGVRCVVSRYGLPDKCHLVKYENDGEDFIEGESALSEEWKFAFCTDREMICYFIFSN